jgi:diadenosine tetraphosphate (Ap4A) HIT family hydrolase|tara:strand:- start:1020 stop:1424 length:405 start_codon:yes stop_codon:yes gene_type:complete
LFVLDQRLENDSILVENKESFQIRLMNVKEFFWVVLIPNKPNLIELSDISVEERNILLNFASDIGDFIKFKENLEKINIGMLGNVVSQLHIHIVVRSKKDPAWPGPVWGWSDTNKLDNNTYDYRLNLVKSFLKT